MTLCWCDETNRAVPVLVVVPMHKPSYRLPCRQQMRERAEISLATLVFPNPHPDLPDGVIGLTGMIDFHVQCESLYGGKFTFATAE